MNKMKNFKILFIIMNGFIKIQVGKTSTFYSSSFALGTAKMTVSTPMAPTMGTMMRATEPLGIKTKVESSTIATMMPQALAFCATVIPPRRR